MTRLTEGNKIHAKIARRGPRETRSFGCRKGEEAGAGLNRTKRRYLPSRSLAGHHSGWDRTGEYLEEEIERMAHRLALDAAALNSH